jgi:hypothetical protein
MLEPLTCPRCKGHLKRQQLKDWNCPHCHIDLGLALSYRRTLALLTLLMVTLVAFATHKPTSGGAWLFRMFVLAIPCWFFLMLSIPPWLKKGHIQPRVTFISSWLGAALSVLLVEFLLFVGAYVLLGASQSELLEHLEMLSMPLASISPNFLITCTRSFLDVCGVILGNSIFFGTVIYAFYLPVRWAFRRARPTQLSIASSDAPEDDD